MTKLTAKFVDANGAKLSIFAKPGKRGIHVAATLRTADHPAQTGCRSTHATDAEAIQAFNALKSEALKNGWIESTKKDRNAFVAIPITTGNAKSKKVAA